MHEIKNFVPLTGRGQFDCAYNPKSGFMSIDVKVFPVYENSPKDKLKWHEREKKQFQQTAAAAIDRHWNGKFRFINRTRNPMVTVTPIFSVAFVPAEKMATVKMRVPKFASPYGKGGLPNCNSYVGLEQINTGKAHATASALLHSQSAAPVNAGPVGAIIAGEERVRIEGLVTTLGLDAIDPGAGGNTLSPQLKVQLANFATRVKAGTEHRPLVPIAVKVVLGPAAGAAMPYLRFARAIKQMLTQCHLANPVPVIHTTDLNLASAARIELKPDLSYETNFNEPIWMNIFAHEYGHMIGLPDEYDPLPSPRSTVPKDVGINRFMDLAEAFGTGVPQMGAQTTSMMCKGTDIMPCHMAPAVQALAQMTGDANWRVN